MSQQIINIPINWDDDAISKCVEKGVVEEVKKDIRNRAMDILGIDMHSRYCHSVVFDDIVKDCVKDIIEANKEYVLEEVIKRVTRSITSTKAYKESKAELSKEK